ncbi:MAG: hypothetical protein ACPGKS_00570 [Coraliomargarita sp.]
MAGFVYFSQPTLGQPASELAQASEFVAPIGFDGVRGRYQGSAGTLAWHHGQHATFEQFEGPLGCAFLWGDAVAEDSDTFLTAERVYDQMVTQNGCEGERILSRYSGMYAWIFLSSDGRLIAGVDPLGVFPIYYFKEGNSFGLATGLAALRVHPDYCAEIDKVGLIRMLIENGGAGVRTLEQSGCRLQIACSITYDAKKGGLALNQHPLPGPHPGEKTLPERDAILQSVEATRSAVRRHCARGVDYALLSGGLDSRHMLALACETGLSPVCCTAGRSSDYESIFASAVAKRLGLDWHCEEDSIERLEADIRDDMTLQSLGGGFSTITLNGGLSSSRHVGTRYLSGLILDVHYAPYYIDLETSPYELGSYDYAFDTWINRFGVDPQTLNKLCTKPEMRDAIDVALQEIRDEWETFEGSKNDVCWWTICYFRGRSHLGGHAWKSSFYAWPVLPGVDLRMIESIRSIDDEHFKFRKLQRQTLVEIAPDLARIPLVTLSHTPKPITPNFRATLQKKIVRTRAKLVGRKRRNDFHRFKRTMGLETPAWKRVRELAEPHRERLYDFFDPDALDAYAPRPEALIKTNWGRNGGGGRRSMYGLMLWEGFK